MTKTMILSERWFRRKYINDKDITVFDAIP